MSNSIFILMVIAGIFLAAGYHDGRIKQDQATKADRARIMAAR